MYHFRQLFQICSDDDKQRTRHSFNTVTGLQLFTFLHQRKDPDIPVHDAISTNVEFIRGETVFWEVVTETVICSELADDRFISYKQISDLRPLLLKVYAVSCGD